MRKGRCQISVGSKAIQNADSAGGGSMGKMRFIIICIPHTRNALSAKGQIQVVMYTIGTIRKWKVGQLWSLGKMRQENISDLYLFELQDIFELIITFASIHLVLNKNLLFFELNKSSGLTVPRSTAKICPRQN